MPTVTESLAKVRDKLHDAVGIIWTDDELLDWFNDGYTEFLEKTRCVTELYQMDLPPRYAYTYCYEWEDAFTSDGPSRMMLLPALNGVYRCTSAWEVEFLEGVATTISESGVTQMWERSLMSTDRHYQVTLPQNHEIIQRVAFDNKVLYPSTVRELDELRSKWYMQGTQPHWWTNGTGRVNTVEIYEIQTEYQQSYAPLDYEDSGFARTFAGSRTYSVDSSAANAYGYTTSGDGQVLDLAANALLSGLGWRFTRDTTSSGSKFATHIWEKELLEGSTTFSSSPGYVCTYSWEYLMVNQTPPSFGVGTIRSIESEDRQYWAQNASNSAAFYGGIRQFQSSDDALEIWHTVVPRVDLTENDTPDLLPSQAHKYLRFFALAKAFGRQGPGMNLQLAGLYMAQFDRGVAAWKKLTNLAKEDQILGREMASGERSARLPLVRLPANFEAW
jgi:hypothetical protein